MMKLFFLLIALFISQTYAFSQQTEFNDRIVNTLSKRHFMSDLSARIYTPIHGSEMTLQLDGSVHGGMVTADLNESISTSIEDHTVLAGHRYEFAKNHGGVSVALGGPCCDNRGGIGYIMVADTIRLPLPSQKHIRLNTPDYSLTWQQIVDKYTISELKGILKSLGIKPSGTEGDMARRYKKAISE